MLSGCAWFYDIMNVVERREGEREKREVDQGRKRGGREREREGGKEREIQRSRERERERDRKKERCLCIARSSLLYYILVNSMQQPGWLFLTVFGFP